MKKTKRLIHPIIVALLLVIAQSCTQSNIVKIGYMLPNLKSERYTKEKQYFSDKVKELGGEALIVSAEYDDKLQIEQANELIKQGAKVLVVNSVNLTTAAAIVRNAHEKNVEVIAYDRIIFSPDLDYYLSFDNVKVGKLMAQYALKMKPEGKYYILGGDKADQNAVLVKNGQMEVISSQIAAGKIKIVYNSYVEDWSGDNAKNEIKRYLNLSQDIPDVILSSYDGMSTGAIEALHEHNLDGKVIVTGQDAELSACRNIVKGNQTMTVYKPLKLLSFKAAEIAIKLARGEKITDVNSKVTIDGKDIPAILLEPITVDKDNLKTTVVADGLLKEAEIFN